MSVGTGIKGLLFICVIKKTKLIVSNAVVQNVYVWAYCVTTFGCRELVLCGRIAIPCDVAVPKSTVNYAVQASSKKVPRSRNVGTAHH